MKKAKIGRVEMILLMIIAFVVVFLSIGHLADRVSTGGYTFGKGFNVGPGTGFMQGVSAPILRMYNGVVRPDKSARTPVLGQDQPDVYPQVAIGGSAPTTPQPLRPYPTFQGW